SAEEQMLAESMVGAEKLLRRFLGQHDAERRLQRVVCVSLYERQIENVEEGAVGAEFHDADRTVAVHVRRVGIHLHRASDGLDLRAIGLPVLRDIGWRERTLAGRGTVAESELRRDDVRSRRLRELMIGAIPEAHRTRAD